MSTLFLLQLLKNDCRTSGLKRLLLLNLAGPPAVDIGRWACKIMSCWLPIFGWQRGHISANDKLKWHLWLTEHSFISGVFSWFSDFWEFSWNFDMKLDIDQLLLNILGKNFFQYILFKVGPEVEWPFLSIGAHSFHGHYQVGWGGVKYILAIIFIIFKSFLFVF